MPNGSDVDQREYGELIANVRHVSEAMGSLSADVAKVHGRMDELFKQMATRAEHEKLASDVGALWDHHRETNRAVSELRTEVTAEMSGSKVDRGWLRDVLWLVVSVLAAAGGYGMGGF